jgi:hypothetical protein
MACESINAEVIRAQKEQADQRVEVRDRSGWIAHGDSRRGQWMAGNSGGMCSAATIWYAGDSI